MSELGRMVSLTADGMLRVWPTDLQTLLHLACRTAGRDLSKEEWNRYIGDVMEQRPVCQNFTARDQQN